MTKFGSCIYMGPSFERLKSNHPISLLILRWPCFFLFLYYIYLYIFFTNLDFVSLFFSANNRDFFLFIYLFIYLSIYLFIYLFIHSFQQRSPNMWLPCSSPNFPEQSQYYGNDISQHYLILPSTNQYPRCLFYLIYSDYWCENVPIKSAIMAVMGLFNGSLICHGQPATQGALLFAEGHVPQYTAGSGTPSSTRMTALKNTYQLFRMLDALKCQELS